MAMESMKRFQTWVTYKETGTLQMPSFVKEVSLRIFNRWGKEVFLDRWPTGASEWRGLDQNGLELSSGVYYFYAKVFFYGLNPAKETQSFFWSHQSFR